MLLFYPTRLSIAALINVAFTKEEDGWRLAWVESRIRYIQLLPHATAHWVKEYQQKHGITSTSSF
jgi:hypothetical protein